MKIGFIVPHLKIAGGTRIILNYASLLSERGHDVRVYVVSKNPHRRFIANLIRLKPKWIKNFSARVIRVSEFTPDNIRHADVLIATTSVTANILAKFPTEAGRQFYLLQHDEGLYHGDRAEVDDAYRHLNQKKIVVATWLQELLKEKYGQHASLLINPIDHEQFRQFKRTINDGTVRILVLHHTYDWKGTKEGARMVHELKKKYPQIRLIMYGVRQGDADEFLPDEYHFNVSQDKLAELYSNIDIFLCPSWDEGFGLPSVEAMACGAAVATYDNGGSRDFAFHEKTALVAPRKNEKALQEELERLVVEQELRKKIAQEGKKYVENMPGWTERTLELEQILQGM